MLDSIQHILKNWLIWSKKKGIVNWWEIEYQLDLESYKRQDIAKAAVFYEIREPQAILPLSGPLVVLTKQAEVLDGIDMSLARYGGLIPFTQLRNFVWSDVNDQGKQQCNWLNLEFRTNPSPGQSGQFRAELTVLDYFMKPCPTSF